ncbi:hypothetical protein ANRL2_02957 [Anaerolineae bacterium]|nr:hypothetical protein ANRL2_02957 [Anaerolineae bacterium]
MVTRKSAGVRRAIDRKPMLSLMLRTGVTDVTATTDHPAFGRIYNPL